MAHKVIALDIVEKSYLLKEFSEETYENYKTIINSATDRDKDQLLDIIGSYAPTLYICKLISKNQFMNIIDLFDDIKKIWFNLLLEFKLNYNIFERLPCVDHYNLPNADIHIDGRPPNIANCVECSDTDVMLSTRILRNFF